MSRCKSIQKLFALKVGVFGSDGDHCSEYAKEIAYEVGKLLAQHGVAVFTGGGLGVMQSACKGAVDADGIAVGILPSDKVIQHNYLTLAIPTGIGFARGQILTNTVDAAIVIEGGLGTREEAGLMYWLEKPTVAIRTSGGTASEIAGKSLDKRNLRSILSANTALEAVDAILGELLRKNKQK